jgi:hypothetical protein
MLEGVDNAVTRFMLRQVETVASRISSSVLMGSGQGAFSSDICQTMRALGITEESVREAFQLASLVPQLTWSQVHCTSHTDPEFRSILAKLQLQMCGTLPLHAICMLSITGYLSEQQRQGVVTLLGGDVAQNSASSCRVTSYLPLKEPPKLAELRRQEGNISLADLLTMLLHDSQSVSSKMPTTLVTYLLVAFTEKQLPHVANFKQAATAAAPQKVPAISMGTKSGDKRFQGLLRDTYLSWMEASLLKIIKEVPRYSPETMQGLMLVEALREGFLKGGFPRLVR